MRSFVFVLLVFVLAVGSCAAGQDPVAIAEQQLEASREGDWAEWRELIAEDAVFVNSDGTTIGYFEPREWIEDDFDGDGLKCNVDYFGFSMALGAVTGREVSWECQETAEDSAECEITDSDTFGELADLQAEPYVLEYTVADGLITRTRAVSTGGSEADAAREFEAQTAYEQWICDTHPDRWEELFWPDYGCGSWFLRWEQDNIPVHEELFAEYLDVIGFES